MIIHGVHIALNINVKDCVKRLCQNILNRHLRYVNQDPKHPSGLHLDIYYPQYGLAIKVQEKQHKHYIEHFHRTLEGFNNLLAQDQLKKELCEKNLITLRYVWYYEDPHIVIPKYL